MSTVQDVNTFPIVFEQQMLAARTRVRRLKSHARAACQSRIVVPTDVPRT